MLSRLGKPDANAAWHQDGMPSSGRISVHRPFTAPINHLDVLVSLHFYWLFSYNSTSTTRTQGGNPVLREAIRTSGREASGRQSGPQGGNPDLREGIRSSGRVSGTQGGYPVLREAIRNSGREGGLREAIRSSGREGGFRGGDSQGPSVRPSRSPSLHPRCSST